MGRRIIKTDGFDKLVMREKSEGTLPKLKLLLKVLQIP